MPETRYYTRFERLALNVHLKDTFSNKITRRAATNPCALLGLTGMVSDGQGGGAQELPHRFSVEVNCSSKGTRIIE